MVPFLGQHV